MKYIFIIMIIILILILFVVLESIRECNKYGIKRYTFKDIGDESFTGLKVAMFSDLHNVVFDEDNNSLIESIRDYEPDLIILAGDMLVCREKHRENNLATAKILNKLCDIAPVYYGMGNHEKGIKHDFHKDMGNNWEEYLEVLDDRISILANEHIKFKKDKVTFSIYGLDLPGRYYSRLKMLKLTKEDMTEYLGEPEKDSYNILIAHNPDYFKVYANWGANLTLSGHNHGGLVKLPLLGGVISPRLYLFPKYSYGLYSNGSSKMLLTNGLGAHSMKIRVGNMPELVFFEIEGK